MNCKYWIELDDDYGTYEYCRLILRKCHCCGEIKQCNYPRKERIDMNKDIMRQAGFCKEVDEIEKGKGNCPFCHKIIDIKDFKDVLSKKEFKISGLCQQCQDRIFKSSEIKNGI